MGANDTQIDAMFTEMREYLEAARCAYDLGSDHTLGACVDAFLDAGMADVKCGPSCSTFDIDVFGFYLFRFCLDVFEICESIRTHNNTACIFLDRWSLDERFWKGLSWCNGLKELWMVGYHARLRMSDVKGNEINYNGDVTDNRSNYGNTTATHANNSYNTTTTHTTNSYNDNSRRTIYHGTTLLCGLTSFTMDPSPPNQSLIPFDPGSTQISLVLTVSHAQVYSTLLVANIALLFMIRQYLMSWVTALR